MVWTGCKYYTFTLDYYMWNEICLIESFTKRSVFKSSNFFAKRSVFKSSNFFAKDAIGNDMNSHMSKNKTIKWHLVIVVHHSM